MRFTYLKFLTSTSIIFIGEYPPSLPPPPPQEKEPISPGEAAGDFCWLFVNIEIPAIVIMNIRQTKIRYIFYDIIRVLIDLNC